MTFRPREGEIAKWVGIDSQLQEWVGIRLGKDMNFSRDFKIHENLEGSLGKFELGVELRRIRSLSEISSGSGMGIEE